MEVFKTLLRAGSSLHSPLLIRHLLLFLILPYLLMFLLRFSSATSVSHSTSYSLFYSPSFCSANGFPPSSNSSSAILIGFSPHIFLISSAPALPFLRFSLILLARVLLLPHPLITPSIHPLFHLSFDTSISPLITLSIPSPCLHPCIHTSI